MTATRPPTAEPAGERGSLAGLLATTRAVLLDFDGPVCDLFAGTSTAGVAARIKRRARRYWGPLAPEAAACDDSHDILQRLRDMYDAPAPQTRGRRPLVVAERIVTRQESRAVRTARPAPHLDDLVVSLRSLGMRLAVVSNNAEAPIRAYLGKLGIEGEFAGVFGRDPRDARLMKPDPDCVVRALECLSLPASQCLLVGDRVTDLKAARSAGTCFLGYTQDPVRAREMREGGANAVVSSYDPVIEAAGTLRPGPPGSGSLLGQEVPD
ncbi:HAD family hydrolase [Streptomyces anandii]|uniref:HAD family hydrolase n=1 Tax=Streptomyces anandii TaxID=285454 RepID=UPI00368F6318